MSLRRLLWLTPLLFIVVLVGQIEAAPPQRAAVLFVDFGGPQWSAADRAEAVLGVQRGIDLWSTGPRPLDLVAYDSGIVQVSGWPALSDLKRTEPLTIYIVETRPGRLPLAEKHDSYAFIGSGWAVVTTDNRWPGAFASWSDFIAAMTAHEIGHAWPAYQLPHALPPACPDDVMGWPANALYHWYVGECSRLWLEEHQ